MAAALLQEPHAKPPPKPESLVLPLPLPPPGMPPPSPLLSWGSMPLGALAARPKPQGTVWGLAWRMSTRWWSLSTTGASPVAGPLMLSPSGLRLPLPPRLALPFFCMFLLLLEPHAAILDAFVLDNGKLREWSLVLATEDFLPPFPEQSLAWSISSGLCYCKSATRILFQPSHVICACYCILCQDSRPLTPAALCVARHSQLQRLPVFCYFLAQLSLSRSRQM